MYWKPLWLYSNTAGFSFHCSNHERHWIFFLWHSFIQKAPPVMILIDFKHTLTAVSFFLKNSVTSVIVLFVYHYLAHVNKNSLLTEAEWIKSFAHSRVAHWHYLKWGTFATANKNQIITTLPKAREEILRGVDSLSFCYQMSRGARKAGDKRTGSLGLIEFLLDLVQG